MTHTPGPWQSHDCTEGERTKFSVYHNGPLAYVGDTGDGPDNCEANARLIAAAPELLAALETIVDRIAQVHKDVNTGEAEMPFVSMNFAAEGVWEIAVKAIANAEGKEPTS